MKLSTQNHYFADIFGYERSTEMLKAAGYDCLDMSLFCLSDRPDTVFLTPDYKKRAKEIYDYARSLDIPFTQSHMAFMYKWEKEGEIQNRVIPHTLRAFEICAIMEIPHIVVHPLPSAALSGLSEEEAREKQIDYYRTLEKGAKEFGVKIAIENAGYTHNIDKYLDICAELNSESFTCLVDIGHAALTDRDPCDFLRSVDASRLSGLHVHDNDYKSDLHRMPGAGKFKWEEIMKTLSDIGYKGELTYEADPFLANFPNSVKPDVASLMVKMGRNLISRFDYYESKKEI